MTLLLEPFALSSQLPSVIRCIIHSTPCHTLVSVPFSSSSLCVLYRQRATKMFECGPEHVYSSSALRCIDILSHPYHSLTALTFFGTPLSFFNSPDFCSDHIYINLVGPHSPSRGYTYLLTCIDHFTHGPEAIPISDITAETSARAFISGWISHFGAPSTISTDRGHRFKSELFTHLMQLLGIKCIRTTTYCPIAKGLVERLHCQLKASLKVQPDPTT